MVGLQLRRFINRLYAKKRLVERLRYRGRGILDTEGGNKLIKQYLEKKHPFAAGKIGESECRGLRCYLRNRDTHGYCNNWDFRNAGSRLFKNAGVFPATPEAFTNWAKTYIRSLERITILTVWFNRGEAEITRRFSPCAELIRMSGLEPFRSDSPWTIALGKRRVLVVTPFVKTVEKQHKRLGKIWESFPEIAAEFDLETLRVPFSAGIQQPEANSWKEKLEELQERMNNINFDVALIGAGAWSVPLAVHCKELGKAGIHLGGATQLIFGIRGRRWDDSPLFKHFYNDYWIRPLPEERPAGADKIEGACYW
jgi:hypothetical protein